MENHIEIETSHKRDKGFTLVELLIVIVILGILATVTVFAVRGITDKGTKSACDADKKTMEVAVESYFAQYGGTAILIGVGDTNGAVAPLDNRTVLPGSAPVRYAQASAELTLKAAGYLRDVSSKVNVDTAGLIVTEVLNGANVCTF